MNKVTLLGRLTKEPELRYTQNNNTAVVKFTLAVNRRFKSENQPEADFINCQAWAKTAEFIGKYFQKGRQVAVIGRIQNRTWDDAEGKKHYITEVIVEEAYFADSKKDSTTNNVSTPTSNSSNNEEFNPIESEDEQLPF